MRLYSFIEIFKGGIGKSYSLEDKSKMVQNQVALMVDEVVTLYSRSIPKYKKFAKDKVCEVFVVFHVLFS